MHQVLSLLIIKESWLGLTRTQSLCSNKKLSVDILVVTECVSYWTRKPQNPVSSLGGNDIIVSTGILSVFNCDSVAFLAFAPCKRGFEMISRLDHSHYIENDSLHPYGEHW